MLFKTFHGWQFATTLLEARNSVLLLQIFYSRHKGKTMTRERLTESQPSASSTQSLHWALLESLINSFSSVQFSHVQLFATTWIAARQASLSITNSRSLLKLMPIESVMPSNHLILCHLLLLPPSIFPSIRVFSKESLLCIRWPNYWSFSFSISPSNEYSGLISFRMDWLDLLGVQGTLKSLFQQFKSIT